MIDEERQCVRIRNSTGERCKQPKVQGSDQCRYHCGFKQNDLDVMTSNLTNIPPKLIIRNKPFASLTNENLRKKLDRAEENEDPTDLMKYIHLFEATIEHTLENCEDEEGRIKVATIQSQIQKMADLINTYNQIKNSNALTANEILLLKVRLPEIFRKYVPQDKIQACLLDMSELFGIIDGAESSK